MGLYLPSFARRRELLAWVRLYAAGLRNLVRSMPRLEKITITYRSGMSFFDQVVPALLLGRFYGTRVVLRYRSNKAEAELESYGRGLLPFLRLADQIEVGCGYLQTMFAYYGVATWVKPEIVDRSLFAPRGRNTVQPNLVVARRLERGNGLTAVVKAFALAKQKYPRAEMTIIGDGPLRPALERLVAEERIFGVTFLGEVSREEVAARMAAADVYLNASTMDGLPVSLLEAMASGLPVVTTDSGDIASVVIDHVNGLIAPANNYPVLADRLIELIENPELVAKLSEEAARSASLRRSRTASTADSEPAA